RHVDPGEVGGGAGGAHGVPPLWLTNAGSGPELASEVEGAGGRAATWFARSGPHALHAVDPAAGPRSRHGLTVTCEPLQQTRPAGSLPGVGSGPLRAGLLGGSVRRQKRR